MPLLPQSGLPIAHANPASMAATRKALRDLLQKMHNSENFLAKYLQMCNIFCTFVAEYCGLMPKIDTFYIYKHTNS